VGADLLVDGLRVPIRLRVDAPDVLAEQAHEYEAAAVEESQEGGQGGEPGDVDNPSSLPTITTAAYRKQPSAMKKPVTVAMRIGFTEKPTVESMK